MCLFVCHSFVVGFCCGGASRGRNIVLTPRTTLARFSHPARLKTTLFSLAAAVSSFPYPYCLLACAASIATSVAATCPAARPSRSSPYPAPAIPSLPPHSLRIDANASSSPGSVVRCTFPVPYTARSPRSFFTSCEAPGIDDHLPHSTSTSTPPAPAAPHMLSDNPTLPTPRYPLPFERHHHFNTIAFPFVYARRAYNHFVSFVFSFVCVYDDIEATEPRRRSRRGFGPLVPRILLATFGVRRCRWLGWGEVGRLDRACLYILVCERLLYREWAWSKCIKYFRIIVQN